MKDFNVNQWLNSDAYQRQVDVIKKEINVNVPYGIGYAKPRFAPFDEFIDRSAFTKSDAEKSKLLYLKKHVTNRGKLKTVWRGIF